MTITLTADKKKLEWFLKRLDYSILKTYRVVTLLYCLRKASEKIIIIRLSANRRQKAKISY